MTTHKKWFIFRHGLATLNPNGYGDQILVAEVLPQGIPPVRRIGEYLKDKPFDYGVRSEFIRCQQTAGIVSEITGRAFIADKRLNEQYQESFEVVHDRLKLFVDEMQQSDHQHIWVCTHGIIIAGLKHFLTTGEYLQKDELDFIMPGEVLIIENQQAQVIRFESAIE